MKKFKFRFDSIQKLKENQKKIVQKELAELNLKIKKLDEEKESLFEKKKSEDSQWKGKVKAFEYNYNLDRKAYLENQIEEYDMKIKNLEQEKIGIIFRLTQKLKETKIFDRLEEVHRQKFKIEQNKIEMNEIDQISNIKSARELK